MIVEVNVVQSGRVAGIDIRWPLNGSIWFSYIEVAGEAMLWPEIDPENGKMLWTVLRDIDEQRDRSD